MAEVASSHSFCINLKLTWISVPLETQGDLSNSLTFELNFQYAIFRIKLTIFSVKQFLTYALDIIINKFVLDEF